MFKRGQVWYVDFGINVGSVQNNIRPALIISNNRGNVFSPNLIVIPLTTSKKKFLPLHVPLLDYSSIRDSTLLCEQITVISKEQVRINGYLESLRDSDMELVEEVVCLSLGISTVSSK